MMNYLQARGVKWSLCGALDQLPKLSGVELNVTDIDYVLATNLTTEMPLRTQLDGSLNTPTGVQSLSSSHCGGAAPMILLGLGQQCGQRTEVNWW